MLGTIFGESYAGAAPVMLPLVLGQLRRVLFGNPAHVLTMTGRHQYVIRMNAWSTGVLDCRRAVVGSVLAGPVGLAIGSAASIALQNGVLWWIAHKELGIWTNVGWFGWPLKSAGGVLRRAGDPRQPVGVLRSSPAAGSETGAEPATNVPSPHRFFVALRPSADCGGSTPPGRLPVSLGSPSSRPGCRTTMPTGCTARPSTCSSSTS